MSEKKLKIIAVVLMVAAFICLAIGTAFAVDFMAEHPEEFACDLNRPVVAANRPFVDPVVEPPLMDVLSAVSSDLVFDYSVYSERSISFSENGDVISPGLYLIEYGDFDGWIADGTLYFLGFGENEEFSFEYEAFTSTEDPLNISLFQLTHMPFSSISVASTTISLTHLNYYVDILLPSDASLESFVFRAVSSLNIAAVGSLYQLYMPSLQGAVWVESIVEILLDGFTGIGESFGEAFSTMANAIFINSDGTGLSTFGILIVVFASVSLGLSLTRFVLNFCTSWGKRNR